MTPLEVAAAARRAYNANGSDPFFSNEQMFEWIHAAQLILATEAWVIKNVFTTTTVAGTRAYAYPTNAIKVRRVTWAGEPLDEITFREDDLFTGADEDVTNQGRPEAFVDFDQSIYLRPIPSTAQTLKIYCYTKPGAVPTSTSTLETPSEYHMTLVHYCLQQMSVKDKNYDGARYYQGIWEQDVARAVEYERAKRRGSRFRVVQNVDHLPTPIFGTI